MKDNETNVFNTVLAPQKTECEDNKYSCKCIDKEKQIEEILDRKTALRVLQDLSHRMSPIIDIFGEASLVISRHNFEVIRKKYLNEIAEDSVVLSREEYEILTKDIEHPTDEVLKRLVVGKNILTEQVIEKTSKETAKKILNDIANLEIVDNKVCAYDLSNKLNELAKQFWVEIKE